MTLSISATSHPKKGRRFLYSLKERKAVADRWIRTLAISALKRSLRIVEYSGGNQQKVVVAKSLAQEPSVVFFDEPTRWVDVGAIRRGDGRRRSDGRKDHVRSGPLSPPRRL
jgi:ABC-type sugar transport system ATPase subunit